MVIGIWNKDAEWSGGRYFSNFGSLKSTETSGEQPHAGAPRDFSNFGSLKSTETRRLYDFTDPALKFQQFRLVEEH